MLFCIRLQNFVWIGAPTAEIWRHIYFSKWRPRPLNTTSGFVFVDVTAFRGAKSLSKFRRDISNRVWDITSGFEIQTSAVLEFYFRFDLDHFAVIGVSFCIRLLNFVQIGTSAAEIWRHIDFRDGGRQPCCVCFGVMADHPRSAFCGLNSDLKSLVRRINSSGDIAM